MNITQLRLELLNRGIKVTGNKIKSVAMSLGIAEPFSEADAAKVMGAIVGQSQPKRPNQSSERKQASVTHTLERSESGIVSSIQQQAGQITQELVAAKDARDRFADKASDALATLALETKPLIYHLAEQKIQSAVEDGNVQSFDLSSAFEEALDVDFFALSSTGLLEQSAPIVSLPAVSRSESSAVDAVAS